MNSQMSLFVPAALGVGIAVSLIALLRDAAHRLRGERWLDRRSAINGRAAALLAVHGPDAALAHKFGRRSRWVYAILGLSSCGLGAYLVLGSYGNYIGWTGWVATIGWIGLAYAIFAAGFVALGTVSLAIAVAWERPPAWTRPFLTHTPLSSVEPREQRAPARHRRPSLRVKAGRERSGSRAPQLVDARVAAALRTIAALWAMVVVIVLSMLAFQDRLPQAPDPATFETAISGPLQIGLLVLVTLGSLIAGRHEPTGAAMMAMAAVGLALLSALQYPPYVAILLSIALAGPAFLHWVAWQRDRHLHHLAALAVVTAMLIGVVSVGADRIYASILGPTHPESAVVLPAAGLVEWAWAGGTTSRSTTVRAKLRTQHRDVRLSIASGSGTPHETRRFVVGRHVAEDIVNFDVDGLTPSRRYQYAVEVDGVLDDARRGWVETFPEGASSFLVAFASCARTGSNGKVYDAIRGENPLLYLALGDLNYGDIRGEDLPRFMRAYDRTLTAPSQSTLYRSTSVGYVWDDHDYGGNDADRSSASRRAAQEAYRLAVPHYPFRTDPADGAIYQSFVVGRVRFVLTDLRSHRDPHPGEIEGTEQLAERTMMGPAQLAWFENELRSAVDEGQAVVWASSSPWIETATETSDAWGGYAAERAQVATMVRDLGIGDRMLMVAGDAHMAAFDDGSNAAYAGPGSGFPVAHGGALDRPGGTKGGPFSGGTFPGSGQYGLLRIDDTGGAELRVTIAGRTWDGRTLFEHSRALRTG